MANLPGSSSDCLSHVRREASTWTNDDLLQFIELLVAQFIESFIEVS